MAKWTFGKKIGLGFAAAVALTIACGTIAVVALRSVVEHKDAVIDHDARALIDVEQVRGLREERSAAFRGYALTGDAKFTDELADINARLEAELADLRRQVAAADAPLVEAVATALAAHTRAIDGVIQLRRDGAPSDQVVAAFDKNVGPARADLDAALGRLVERETALLADGRDNAGRAADQAILVVIVIAIAAAIIGLIIAVFLTRSLSGQIGTAVGQVQSSSTELQAAATQQAASAREQATAMTEIATTITELLATSRQIAESAQRVAAVAGETATAARAGDGTVGSATSSIGGIRRQVDLVVEHMLDLGKKSQQIGGILDIVSELAEQTNILAINATIEAAGAGDAGKRFAIVADEIRKLADRVAAATKEVRVLIDDVRAAVNRTVMATETGSKAVDAGSGHVGHVAHAFKQIADLVGTTTEAAREIELSTKQQASAVEQVNTAIANIASATKETEASTTQTLQTVSQLATLSRDLRRVVQSETPGAAA